jgi:hypothetical protein
MVLTQVELSSGTVAKPEAHRWMDMCFVQEKVKTLLRIPVDFSVTNPQRRSAGQGWGCLEELG